VEFKDRLRSLRSGSGESLQQLADAIGVSKAHVWEMEVGRSSNPSLEILQKLAEHFDVTIASLVETAPEKGEKAEEFFRKNHQAIEAMDENDLAYIASLMARLTEKK
jgi:transcriptional regulator with XRE-family HTH domain